VHFTYTPELSPSGAVLGFVLVIADITMRKNAETELERARDHAVAASRAKDDFLAALSHELRTPLNPVLLLASDGAVNPDLSAEVRADFTTIRNNAELEARLIDDLLDLTRIARGKLAIEQHPVDLQTVISEAITIVRPDLKEKQIELVLHFHADGRLIQGDAVRLQQVFWNVLKNAVKFTPEAGKITVETRVDEPRRVVVLTIADTGIGLAPDELDRIFQAFSQGNHAGGGGSHRFGGLGLGLAISRMLIELHAGTIRATSAGPGTGAAFVIELPLAVKVALELPPPEPQAIAALASAKRIASNPPLPATTPETSPRARVLLIDDHAPTRTTLAHLLGRRRYEVVSAGSKAEALALAGAGNFDVIVSDIGLPDGDGYALLKELRTTRPDLPGIALSGYGMEQDITRSRQAGFVEHLTKPISIGTLERALAAILTKTDRNSPPRS
jgi:signal transduction histidine kinase/ActR/RegA family two-component response regulator